QLMEFATQQYVRAPPHYVEAPPAGVERYSIAFFLGGRLSEAVSPLKLPEGLQHHSSTADARPVEVGPKVLTNRLLGYPEAARRHHPDLLAALNPSAPVSADG